MIDPENLVAQVAAQYDDEEGELTRSALLLLQQRRAAAGKTCERCRERKPLSAFSKDARNPDALRRYCRTCAAKADHKRALREAVREA